MKKIIALLMAVLMTAGMLAACSSTPAEDASPTVENTKAQAETAVVSGEKEKVTLKVWADQGELELTEKLCNEFAAEHPAIQLNTLYNRYQYAVAAVYIVSTRPEHGELFDYISYLKFSTRDAKQAYIAQIQKRSLIDTGVKMTADDRLLTLSTCTYEFADARLVVVARQLREGESAEDFGKQVVKRENPVMPQIWNELFG